MLRIMTCLNKCPVLKKQRLKKIVLKRSLFLKTKYIKIFQITSLKIVRNICKEREIKLINYFFNSNR